MEHWHIGEPIVKKYPTQCIEPFKLVTISQEKMPRLQLNSSTPLLQGGQR